MNGTWPTSANVYYLPVRTPTVETARRAVRKPRFMSRVEHAWWRVRFMSAEIWSILRRGSRQLFVDDSLDFDRSVELPRPRTRHAAPARVIDFESARDRLRAAQA